MEKSKSSKTFSIIIFFIIAAVIISISVVSYRNAGEILYGDFNNQKKSKAEMLYNDIKKFDEKGEYPQTPDEVMEIYNKCYLLLYGDMINNEDIFAEVLHIQRELYSDEFITMNDYESQLEKLKEDIKTLENDDVCVIDISTKSAIYDKNHNSCFIKAVVSTNARFKFYFKYHFIMDQNGLWKIQTVESSEEE